MLSATGTRAYLRARHQLRPSDSLGTKSSTTSKSVQQWVSQKAVAGQVSYDLSICSQPRAHYASERTPRGASSFQVRGTSPIRSGNTVERGAVPQMGALGLKNCGEGAYTATCGPIEEHGVRGLELARKIISELCGTALCRTGRGPWILSACPVHVRSSSTVLINLACDEAIAVPHLSGDECQGKLGEFVDSKTESSGRQSKLRKSGCGADNCCRNCRPVVGMTPHTR